MEFSVRVRVDRTRTVVIVMLRIKSGDLFDEADESARCGAAVHSASIAPELRALDIA
jgi:hypothetical protein